jgi:uncharacterized protein
MMDSKQYGPWAFIAGGSEGVGAAFAHKLAAAGISLILSARKSEPLEEVAQQVRNSSSVTVRTLPLDLTSPDMLDRVEGATKDVEVGTLIYNAGAETIINDFLDRDLPSNERMIALNIVGPTRLAYHFTRGMRERRRGGVIMVGSLAAYAGGPRTIMYAGAKAFQYVFTQGLWYELRPYNVHVLALLLGVTRTPAVARMGMKFDSPNWTAAEPENVAQEGLDKLAEGPVWHAGGNEEVAKQLRGMPLIDIMERSAAAQKAIGI